MTRRQVKTLNILTRIKCFINSNYLRDKKNPNILWNDLTTFQCAQGYVKENYSLY